jgi:hypothetical protein
MNVEEAINNSEGVVATWRRIGCNPFRVVRFVGTISQGSSFLATLG